MNQPTCVVENCTRSRQHGRYCNTCRHAKQKAKKPHPSRVGSCIRCGVLIDREGVTGPMPRYCSEHCRKGYRDIPASSECPTCGTAFVPTVAGKKYCSRQCFYIGWRHPEGRPKWRRCAQCSVVIDLTERLINGRLRNLVTTSRCDECRARARPHRYGVTARDIAERDGYECRWCGLSVDFALVGSRKGGAPSIDHIIPWSLGGSNRPSNLQLMHRRCNSAKGARAA